MTEFFVEEYINQNDSWDNWNMPHLIRGYYVVSLLDQALKKASDESTGALQPLFRTAYLLNRAVTLILENTLDEVPNSNLTRDMACIVEKAVGWLGLHVYVNGQPVEDCADQLLLKAQSDELNGSVLTVASTLSSRHGEYTIDDMKLFVLFMRELHRTFSCGSSRARRELVLVRETAYNVELVFRAILLICDYPTQGLDIRDHLGYIQNKLELGVSQYGLKIRM